MPFTTPPTAVDGTPVASAHVNTLSANSSWFNGLLQTPAAAGQVPQATSASAAAYGLLSAANVHDGAVGTAQYADLTIATAQLAAGAVDSTILASDVVARIPPSGLGAWVRLAGDIATGWSRETSGDGRFFVGAGTTFTVTFVEETNSGSSWAHDHPFTASIAAGSPSTVDTNFSPSGTGTAAHINHTHALSGTTNTASWVIPSRGYVAVRRA
jgi:hypothetical protein